MAKQVQSSLMAKYGSRMREAHEAHRTDDTVYSGAGQLPPGIENGIAQLDICKFDTYKKGDMQGEYYFYAAGIVKEPIEFNGRHVEGLRTSIMEPVCDTPKRSRKSLDEHVAHIYNELRKLGVDTATLEFDDLETTVEALSQAKPHFSFRTWQGEPTPEFPNPRVNEQWGGTCEYTEPTEPGGVDDQTPTKPKAPAATTKTQSNGKPPSKKPPTTTAQRRDVADVVATRQASAPDPKKKPGKKAEPEQTADDIDSFDGENEDIDALVELAESGDEVAKAKLQKIAGDAGYTEDDIAAADDWPAVAEMIRAGQKTADEEPEEGEETEDEEPEEDEELSTEKGDIWFYRPIDKKTNKPVKKPVECEVLLVNKKDKTVNLRSTADPSKEYKKVPYADLIGAEEE